MLKDDNAIRITWKPLVYKGGFFLLVLEIFIYKLKRRVTERSSIPNRHNSQVWAKLKTGVRNSLLVSHKGGRGPRTRGIFHCLLGLRSISRELALQYGLQVFGSGRLTHCATKLALGGFFFKSPSGALVNLSSHLNLTAESEHPAQILFSHKLPHTAATKDTQLLVCRAGFALKS